MPHEVDELGYPTDPEMNQLQGHLGDLAADWRDVARGLDGQDQIVREYHATMERLYELGWDDVLDVEAELPDYLMPGEYLRRHRSGG